MQLLCCDKEVGGWSGDKRLEVRRKVGMTRAEADGFGSVLEGFSVTSPFETTVPAAI